MHKNVRFQFQTIITQVNDKMTLITVFVYKAMCFGAAIYIAIHMIYCNSYKLSILRLSLNVFKEAN